MNATEARRRTPVVSSGTSLQEVARVMADTGSRAVVVTDHDGLPVGIVTERDLVVRSLAWNLPADTPVDRVMTPDLITAHPSAPARFVYRLLRAHGINQVALVEDGRVVGIVSRDDLVDEANAELIAGLRHCPRCGGEWLRPVSTSDATNFLCVLCRSCWHLQDGSFIQVETRSCRGCPEHNFCRFPLIDYGVDVTRLQTDASQSLRIRDAGLCFGHPAVTDDDIDATGRDQEDDPQQQGLVDA